MSERKPKPKQTIPTRRPKPKGDMFANLRRPEEIDSVPIEELLAPTRPLQKSEPLSKNEPVGKLAPVKNQTEPLQNEPVRKNEPVRFSAAVKLLSQDAAHLRFPYEVFDQILKELKPAPRVILERLYRLAAGWNSDECVVSINKLHEHCNIEETQIRKHLAWLEQRGFIKRLENVVGGSDLSLRGIRFRILLPRIPLLKSEPAKKSGPLSESEPNKVNTLKETHTNTEDVSVRSRFALSDCRKYAEHLKATGQGITNPGGYATKIHRSGEADELIERFLAPAQSSVDASQCPDCQGTGFYYPNGMSGGVMKCKHEKLTAQQ
jgi:hypothetical protein